MKKSKESIGSKIGSFCQRWLPFARGTFVTLIILFGAREYHQYICKRKIELYKSFNKNSVNVLKIRLKSAEAKRFEACKSGYIWTVSILAFDKKFKFKELRKTGVLKEIHKEIIKKCDYFYPRDI